ncbi:MAG: hypothetical protein ACYCO0_00840 [Candidatus Micrarchaeaceae archaeon]
MFFDTFRDGIDAVLHPDKVTKGARTVGDALLLYYNFSVIPLILLAIVALGAGFFLGGVLAAMGLVHSIFTGSLALLAVAGVIVYVWGLVPLGLLVSALILHYVGRGLNLFRVGDYSSTFTAVVYSALGPLSVLWLSVLPVVGGVIQLVAFVWSVYVLVVVLANVHKGTRSSTFVAVIGGALVAWLIVAVVAQLFAIGLFGTLVGPLIGVWSHFTSGGLMNSTV